LSRLPPPTIPDHTVVCRIGGGSYGEVWLARSVLGELRAVKVISRSRFNDERPFQREFEGIQRFEPISRSHPSQLAILHVGKNDDAGCFYYVMELADATPNPNDECRNPKETRSPNAENGTRNAARQAERRRHLARQGVGWLAVAAAALALITSFVLCLRASSSVGVCHKRPEFSGHAEA